MSRILKVTKLCVKIGSTPIVRGIDFAIEQGEIIGLVGESGSGKSMTGKAIMGLLPADAAIEGQLIYNHEDLAEKSENEMQKIRGKEIGMIFQDPMSALNPTMKIKTQLIEGISTHLRMPYDACYARALELLDAVEISEPKKRMEQYPFELSGGMRQRVLIAMALACHPKLLIADEPTTALDASVQLHILQLLKKIRDKMSLAILLITHDLNVVAEICNKVMVMYAGKIVEYGTPQEILESPNHPYTQALLRSRPKVGQDGKLQPIQGYPPIISRLPSGCAFHPRCQHAMEICQASEPQFFEKKACCWMHRRPK